MAKGSSSQQGVDPLGIGVPQYARSSYDPVEFARRAWSDYAHKQAVPDKEKRKEYDDWMKQFVTPDAFEESFSSAQNDKILKASQRATDEFRSGTFDPLNPGETGMSLQKEMNEINNETRIYNNLKALYQRDYNTLKNPAVAEDIDHELTQEKFKAFLSEPDLQEKSNLIMESLVVLKPKPVEVMNELKNAVGYVFQGGLDKDITQDSFDPLTGMIKVATLEGMSPERVETGMRKAWNMLSDRVKKEFERRYENAPRSQKVAMEDGAEIPISTEDWFIAQHSPEYARKMNISYTRRPEDRMGFSWSTYLPGKKDDGTYDLRPMTKTFGRKTQGEKPGQMITSMAEFNSEHSIPLQQVFTKSFPMQVSRQTIDNETGNQVEQAKVIDNQPVSVEFAPIAPRTMTFTEKSGKEWSFGPGEIIPKEVQTMMDLNDQRDLYEFEAFVISAVDYNKQPTVIQVGETSVQGRTRSFAQTNRMPYREAVIYMNAAASNQKVDLKPLTESVNDILFQLNRRTNRLKKVEDIDAAYNEHF